MLPDDPRHGTYAGAVAHWLEARDKVCDDCARAERRYRKQRQMDALRGRPRTVSALGVVRRVRALYAIGWTGPAVAAEAGVSVHTMRSFTYRNSATVRRSTLDALAAAYDRLCMTWPEGQYADRARITARRRGWSPPNAWIDIDDPDETPDPGYIERNPWQHGARKDVDPVVVDRILGGDAALASSTSRSEKAAVVAEWQRLGRALNDLERLTGWETRRYISVAAEGTAA